ncbi:MAG: energy-coupling factor transporter transmembrane protein EcfT, partial [Actinobacteria bacterium]|nr:energy-coupling factor transporter transmembrane protein EcfT [Actinomycetota bacterium]
MRSIPIGQYYPAESIVHRADPRVKILLVLIFSIALFAVGNLTAFALTLGLILALAGLGKIPVKLLVRGLKPIMLILLFALVMNAFFTPGPTLKLFFFESERKW